MITEQSKLAAAIGAKLLEWRGSEIIEVVYMLQEKKTMEAFREMYQLSYDDKNKVIRFMRGLRSGGRDKQKNTRAKVDCNLF